MTTRDHRGRLDSLLARAGADVLHVPLIEVTAPLDGGAELDAALASVDEFDWVVVTSRHGAARVGGALSGRPDVGLAAVGTRTAAVLAQGAGRRVEVVPDEQTGAALASALPGPSGRVLVAQAERADSRLADGLVARGFEVTSVVAYRTVLRTPTWRERRAALAADAVCFASGSAAEAWAAAFGPVAPPIVAAIGPTTARAAAAHGLKVTHVATDHDIDGLVAVTTRALTAPVVESVRPTP